MRPSEGPLAYPESSHSATQCSPRSKAAVVNVPATQSAVPLCSRSQAVIAASTAGSGCAQVILAKRGRQPASGAGLIKARALTFVSTWAVAGRYTIGPEGERFIASI